MNIPQTLIAFYCISIAPLHITHAQESAPTKGSDTAPDSEGFSIILPDTEAKDESSTDTKNASSEDLTLELPDTSEQGSRESDETIYILDDFVVTSEGDKGYYSANSISATRTNALVKNTPISLTVINEQMMEDLNILNDQDLVRATASVTQDPDGFSLNQLRIRGFRSLTQRYDLFWREIERDGYNIQRVDIVKGANSLMYGQADPGGQINSVPKLAQIGDNFANVKATVGNKDYLRGEFDVNHTLSDEVAVRVMGVDFSRELDQLYEYADLRGATIEASYRPTNNTQLRAHIEYIDLDQNLAPNMFNSTSNDSRFAKNSFPDETTFNNVPNPPNPNANRETFTLGTYRNEFIYSPDAIDYLPQAIIDDLVLDAGYAAQLGIDPEDVTRDVLKQIYAPWASQDDRYSVTGPDKFNRRQGLITTFDWTQRISDSLQAKIAVNREDDDREALARDGYGAGRVQSDNSGPRAYDPYVETFWRKQDGRTQANALKSTLLWDIELDNDLPLIGGSEHKLLLGADWDQLLRDSKMYHQLQEGTVLRDGAYFNSGDLLNERFYLSDGFGPNTPNIGYNGRDDLFALRQQTEVDIQTQSLWFAAQSSFMDGRLRSLAGLRYDHIDIDYSLFNYRYGVSDNYVNNNLDGDYSRAVTRIDDANNSFEQVSPTIGALYWITDSVAFFANYAQSIQSPNGVNVDPLGDIIPPVYGEGYEYGFRFDMLDGKLNGQITAFYIEKENDNIVNYDFRLGDIYTFEEYGASNPEIFNPNGTLNNNLLPGKQVAGDVSRSEGIEVEFFYNPTKNLSFVLSYTYNNLDAIEINEQVNPRFAQVFGQAPHNALLIGRYKFTDGALKGLTIGANQRFRSASTMGQWYIDDQGPEKTAEGTGQWYEIEFDPEFVTDAFLNYQTKIGSGRKAPQLNIGLRVNNLWDTTELINRNKSGFHRPSRQYLLSASMRF
jgi:outer membrane receptor protein involved in Fe transport